MPYLYHYKTSVNGPVPPPRAERDQIPVKGDGGCSVFYRRRKIHNPVSVIFFTVLAVVVFLSPPTGRAARIAGEDQPVQTAPSPSTVPTFPKPADRKETPARTEAVKSAAGQTAAPAESTPDSELQKTGAEDTTGQCDRPRRSVNAGFPA